jgi:hypothetical protein
VAAGNARAGAVGQVLASVQEPQIIHFGGHIEYGDTNDCPGRNMLPEMTKFRKELNFKVPVKRSGL